MNPLSSIFRCNNSFSLLSSAHINFNSCILTDYIGFSHSSLWHSCSHNSGALLLTARPHRISNLRIIIIILSVSISELLFLPIRREAEHSCYLKELSWLTSKEAQVFSLHKRLFHLTKNIRRISDVSITYIKFQKSHIKFKNWGILRSLASSQLYWRMEAFFFPLWNKESEIWSVTWIRSYNAFRKKCWVNYSIRAYLLCNYNVMFTHI